MAKLDKILSDKPKMENCRVFYIHVGGASPDDVPHIVKSVKKSLSNFDTKNVIFVPTRQLETGWQFPE